LWYQSFSNFKVKPVVSFGHKWQYREPYIFLQLAESDRKITGMVAFCNERCVFSLKLFYCASVAIFFFTFKGKTELVVNEYFLLHQGDDGDSTHL
jgi:hypothetical protein